MNQRRCPPGKQKRRCTVGKACRHSCIKKTKCCHLGEDTGCAYYGEWVEDGIPVKMCRERVGKRVQFVGAPKIIGHGKYSYVFRANVSPQAGFDGGTVAVKWMKRPRQPVERKAHCHLSRRQCRYVPRLYAYASGSLGLRRLFPDMSRGQERKLITELNAREGGPQVLKRGERRGHLRGTKQTGSTILIMELMKSVESLKGRFTKIDVDEVMHMVDQFVDTCRPLARRKYYQHNDLRPRNILYKEAPTRRVYKLTDFGKVKVVSSPEAALRGEAALRRGLQELTRAVPARRSQIG